VNTERARAAWLLTPLACCFLASAGCASGQLGPAPPGPHDIATTGVGYSMSNEDIKRSLDFFKPNVPPPGDSFVLRAEGLEADKTPTPGSPEADLAGARELFRQGDYANAEALYSRLAENSHIAPAIAEEARYYEAECLRLEGRYPRAADTYADLLNKFPQSAFREQAIQHMFDIANYWLVETREDMRNWKEYQDGKRWVYWPHLFSFEKSKPLLDREGRAVEKLEQVRIYDGNGPLADQALFLCGSVKFFNEDYREADHFFSQISERHPNSPLAPQAVELAIISKHLSTGGSDYDGRKAAEARNLVQTALNNYPELQAKREFLERQLVNISLQQAEKEFKMAEFYRRTGHPGAAYFYYGLVCRRYHGTPYAEQAAQKLEEMKAKLEKDQGAPLPAAGPRAPLPPSYPQIPAPTPPGGAAEPAPRPQPLMPVPGT
jgi:outer membrane protein assembly factor BamD (BamD/ComL family)